MTISEFLNGLVGAFILLNILAWLMWVVADALRQHYIRKLCKYRGAGGKPGRECVICAYHHKCNRAKWSVEYKQYAYYRKVLPHRAKEMFDAIWAEETAGVK